MFCFLLGSAFSQTEVGIIVSPSLSANRVATEDYSPSIKAGGARLKLALGAFADVFLAENYYFSSGISLATKNAGVKYVSSTAGQASEEYRLQYIQIPLTLKLFTNEVALDKRIFVQFGILNEIKIDEKRQTGNTTGEAIGGFRFYDFSGLLRAGLDFRIGYDTSVFAAISYTRGLTNVLRDHSYPVASLQIKNDIVGLDFGIKF